MPLFVCKLGAPDGSLQERELEAGDEQQLRAGLVEQGYRVFSVTRKTGAFLLPGLGRFSRRIGTEELLSLNQELIVLLKAGLPIVPILDAVLEHRTPSSNLLSRILNQAREDVKAGMALSATFGRHQGVFPPLYLASLRAGEKTGDLPGIIQRYLVYLKRIDVVRKKVLSSLFYPAILITVAMIAIGLLLVYVVPTFSQVYADAGSQLPLITRMLITFSHTLQAGIVVWLPGLALAVWGVQHWSSSSGGRQRLDRLKIRVPLLGPVFFSYAVSGFSRTLATLLGSGIPLVEALRMASGTLNNSTLEQAMLQVIRQVEEGGRFVVALKRHRLMPPLALRMLGVGENTGSLEEMLTAVAEHLEEYVEERIRMISTMVEPVIMVLMGAIIGFIIVAMYLPVFKLAGTVGS